MGWKGTVRSIQAAARRADREAQRRQKELEKQEKLYAKMEALEQAKYEVAVYENQLEVIQSVHKEWGNLIDWEAIANAPSPKEPINEGIHEKNFKPGLITKLFGSEDKARKKAIERDEKAYDKKYKHWEAEYKKWETDKSLADKLLSNDDEAKIGIIRQMNPFKDISELGSTLSFITHTNGIIEVELFTHGSELIPTEVKSLLQSGKLSVKKMPKGTFNEIYQDYISSCVLRVGNELLAILPERIALIHVMDKMLNTKTGHMEEQCILSVAITRETIANLNMDNIDPSDSLANFVHNMTYKKTKGLEVVERLNPNSFEL